MRLPIGQGFKLRIRSYFSFSRSPYSPPVPRSPCACSQFLVLVTSRAIESIVVPSILLAVWVALMQALHLRRAKRATRERERKPLTLAPAFACCSRVTSRDSPKWRACSQASGGMGGYQGQNSVFLFCCAVVLFCCFIMLFCHSVLTLYRSVIQA